MRNPPRTATSNPERTEWGEWVAMETRMATVGVNAHLALDVDPLKRVRRGVHIKQVDASFEHTPDARDKLCVNVTESRHQIDGSLATDDDGISHPKLKHALAHIEHLVASIHKAVEPLKQVVSSCGP